MDRNTLNSFGLVLDILGASLLFKFGFPQPDHQESIGLSLEDNTPVGNGMTAKEYAQKVRNKKRIYQAFSLLGLTLLIAGFALQLWSNLLPEQISY